MSLTGAKFICLDRETDSPGTVVTAKGRKFTIGYYMSCDYVLDDERAKGVHCEIECDAFARVTIRNMSDANPVMVDDKAVGIKRALRSGSHIQILDHKFLWEFPIKKCNELAHLADKTPEKMFKLNEPAPNSCPDFKLHRKVPKRLTVHRFGYSINSDDEGNSTISSSDTESPEKSVANAEADKSLADASAIRDKTPERDAPSEKIDLIDSTENKENPSSVPKKKLLSFCQQSDVVITSFSPRETGVRVEKSFTAIMRPTERGATTPKSVYSTPRSLLAESVDEASRDFIDFSTPATSNKLRDLNSAKSSTSSMHLIDFTSIKKLAPASPAPKSASKCVAKKLIDSPKSVRSAELDLGVKKMQATPKRNTPTTPYATLAKTDSAASAISVESSGSDSVIEVSDDSLSTTDDPKMKERTPSRNVGAGALPSRAFAVTTPKRTPQSLMKRALLSSAIKQARTPGRTLAGTPDRPLAATQDRSKAVPQLLLTSPGSPVTPRSSVATSGARRSLLEKRSATTPGLRRSVAALQNPSASPTSAGSSRLSVCKRLPMTSRMSAGVALSTSTPQASGNSALQRSASKTDYLHKVRKSIGGVPLGSHVSKARRSLLPTRQSPPSASSKILAKARRSVYSPILNTRASRMLNASREKSLAGDGEKNKTLDVSGHVPPEDLSRTFLVDSECEEAEPEKSKRKDATFSPEREANHTAKNATFSPEKDSADKAATDSSVVVEKEQSASLEEPKPKESDGSQDHTDRNIEEKDTESPNTESPLDDTEIVDDETDVFTGNDTTSDCITLQGDAEAGPVKDAEESIKLDSVHEVNNENKDSPEKDEKPENDNVRASPNESEGVLASAEIESLLDTIPLDSPDVIESLLNAEENGQSEMLDDITERSDKPAPDALEIGKPEDVSDAVEGTDNSSNLTELPAESPDDCKMEYSPSDVLTRISDIPDEVEAISQDSLQIPEDVITTVEELLEKKAEIENVTEDVASGDLQIKETTAPSLAEEDRIEDVLKSPQGASKSSDDLEKSIEKDEEAILEADTESNSTQNATTKSTEDLEMPAENDEDVLDAEPTACPRDAANIDDVTEVGTADATSQLDSEKSAHIDDAIGENVQETAEAPVVEEDRVAEDASDPTTSGAECFGEVIEADPSVQDDLEADQVGVDSPEPVNEVKVIPITVEAPESDDASLVFDDEKENELSNAPKTPNLRGIRELMKTPKQATPNFVGVRRLLRTPKASAADDSIDMTHLPGMLQTPTAREASSDAETTKTPSRSARRVSMDVDADAPRPRPRTRSMSVEPVAESSNVHQTPRRTPRRASLSAATPAEAYTPRRIATRRMSLSRDDDGDKQKAGGTPLKTPRAKRAALPETVVEDMGMGAIIEEEPREEEASDAVPAKDSDESVLDVFDDSDYEYGRELSCKKAPKTTKATVASTLIGKCENTPKAVDQSVQIFDTPEVERLDEQSDDIVPSLEQSDVCIPETQFVANVSQEEPKDDISQEETTLEVEPVTEQTNENLDQSDVCIPETQFVSNVSQKEPKDDISQDETTLEVEPVTEETTETLDQSDICIPETQFVGNVSQKEPKETPSLEVSTQEADHSSAPIEEPNETLDQSDICIPETQFVANVSEVESKETTSHEETTLEVSNHDLERSLGNTPVGDELVTEDTNKTLDKSDICIPETQFVGDVSQKEPNEKIPLETSSTTEMDRSLNGDTSEIEEGLLDQSDICIPETQFAAELSQEETMEATSAEKTVMDSTVCSEVASLETEQNGESEIKGSNNVEVSEDANVSQKEKEPESDASTREDQELQGGHEAEHVEKGQPEEKAIVTGDSQKETASNDVSVMEALELSGNETCHDLSEMETLQLEASTLDASALEVEQSDDKKVNELEEIQEPEANNTDYTAEAKEAGKEPRTPDRSPNHHLTKTPKGVAATPELSTVETPKRRKTIDHSTVGAGDVIEAPKDNATSELSDATKTPDMRGIRNMLKTPRIPQTPELATYQALIETPKRSHAKDEAAADIAEPADGNEAKTPDMRGVRKMLQTPKISGQDTPRLGGIRDLLRTPKNTKTIEDEAEGVADLMATPKVEQPSTSEGTTARQGTERMLRTPKFASTPHTRGLRELFQTPKVSSTPYLGGIKKLLETPAQQSDREEKALPDGAEEELNREGGGALDKFLKTPRAKHLMIPQTPASAVIEKVSVEADALTEYPLDESSAPQLDELFKTPSLNRFVGPADSPAKGADDNLDEMAQPMDADEAFEKLAGEQTVRHESHHKVYRRNSSHSPTASKIGASAENLDLPKTDLEEWLDTVEPADEAPESEEAAAPGEAGRTPQSVDESAKRKATLQAVKTPSFDMSGIDVLDEHETSQFSEVLCVSDTEDVADTAAVDEANRTCGSQAEDGLDEPLVVSDTDSQNDTLNATTPMEVKAPGERGEFDNFNENAVVTEKRSSTPGHQKPQAAVSRKTLGAHLDLEVRFDVAEEKVKLARQQQSDEEDGEGGVRKSEKKDKEEAKSGEASSDAESPAEEEEQKVVPKTAESDEEALKLEKSFQEETGAPVPAESDEETAKLEKSSEEETGAPNTAESDEETAKLEKSAKEEAGALSSNDEVVAASQVATYNFELKIGETAKEEAESPAVSDMPRRRYARKKTVSESSQSSLPSNDGPKRRAGTRRHKDEAVAEQPHDQLKTVEEEVKEPASDEAATSNVPATPEAEDQQIASAEKEEDHATADNSIEAEEEAATQALPKAEMVAEGPSAEEKSDHEEKKPTRGRRGRLPSKQESADAKPPTKPAGRRARGAKEAHALGDSEEPNEAAPAKEQALEAPNDEEKVAKVASGRKRRSGGAEDHGVDEANDEIGHGKDEAKAKAKPAAGTRGRGTRRQKVDDEPAADSEVNSTPVKEVKKRVGRKVAESRLASEETGEDAHKASEPLVEESAKQVKHGGRKRKDSHHEQEGESEEAPAKEAEKSPAKRRKMAAPAKRAGRQHKEEAEEKEEVGTEVTAATSDESHSLVDDENHAEAAAVTKKPKATAAKRGARKAAEEAVEAAEEQHNADEEDKKTTTRRRRKASQSHEEDAAVEAAPSKAVAMLVEAEGATSTPSKAKRGRKTTKGADTEVHAEDEEAHKPVRKMPRRAAAVHEHNYDETSNQSAAAADLKPSKAKVVLKKMPLEDIAAAVSTPKKAPSRLAKKDLAAAVDEVMAESPPVAPPKKAPARGRPKRLASTDIPATPTLKPVESSSEHTDLETADDAEAPKKPAATRRGGRKPKADEVHVDKTASEETEAEAAPESPKKATKAAPATTTRKRRAKAAAADSGGADTKPDADPEPKESAKGRRGRNHLPAETTADSEEPEKPKRGRKPKTADVHVEAPASEEPDTRQTPADSPPDKPKRGGRRGKAVEPVVKEPADEETQAAPESPEKTTKAAAAKRAASSRKAAAAATDSPAVPAKRGRRKAAEAEVEEAPVETKAAASGRSRKVVRFEPTPDQEAPKRSARK